MGGLTWGLMLIGSGSTLSYSLDLYKVLGYGFTKGDQVGLMLSVIQARC